MPWYWTDDLARTLIASGKVQAPAVSGWIVAPVAIRSEEQSAEDAARVLLEDDGDPPASPAALAA